MKVLHVAETMRGGIASYLNDYLITLVDNPKGYDVVVLCPDEHLKDLNINKITSDNKINFVGFKKYKNRVLSSFLMCFSFVSIFLSFKPDVVHLHSTFAGFFLRIPIRLLSKSVNVVYCPHGWAFDRKGHPISNKLTLYMEKVLSFFLDYIVCISNYEYNLALSFNFDAEKLVLVTNGIIDDLPANATDKEIIWPKNKVRVLFVGRFDDQKGIDVFFKSMNNSPNAFAYVIGSSVLNGKNKNYIIPDNCMLVGWLPRDLIVSYYDSADVLIMPSRWEGFGLTAIEAMRSKLAVIATDVGGLSEIVLDGVTGYLVEPEDHASISNIIKISGRDKFKELGVAGYYVFKDKFTMIRVLNSLDEIYNRKAGYF